MNEWAFWGFLLAVLAVVRWWVRLMKSGPQGWKAWLETHPKGRRYLERLGGWLERREKKRAERTRANA